MTLATELSPVNILLVDDEPKNLIALESVLEDGGWNLVRAGSGPEALKHLLQDDFAVILLDVHMPGLDGFETAELIRGRERSRNTPIIFLTAAIRGDTFISKGYAIGAVDYILKPLEPDILRSKVSVFVELFRKTEQLKRQADQLAETTAFLNSVLEGATEYAITALDLEGKFLAWNEGARRIYGYDAQEMVGQQHFRALHPPGEAAVRAAEALLRKAARSGKAEGVFEHVRKNGRRFSASVSLTQRRDAGVEPVGYMSISKDITQLERAERERAQLIEEQTARAEAEAARDRLQQILDVLPEAVVIADRDGRFVLSNSVAREFMGGMPPAVDLAAYDAFGALHLDGSPYAPDELPLTRVARQGEAIRGEQLLLAHAGTGLPVPVLVNGAPLRDPTGKPAGGVIVFQDISPIKDLEQQKDAFLAAASHDLKNPLAAIKGRAQILQRRAAREGVLPTQLIVDGLRGIDQAASGLTRMIDELLDVTRLQMGRPLALDRRPTDLVDLARQVASEFQPTTDRHEIRVESIAPHVIGDWDRARLERVLTNLVSNAIKYSPNGGPITLAVLEKQARGKEWAGLQVRDRGVGIPAEEQARVFERFYRASNVAGSIEGTGLGLTGVRQIAEHHGGHVSIESEEQRGSSFTVWLPREVQPTDELPVARGQDAPSAVRP